MENPLVVTDRIGKRGSLGAGRYVAVRLMGGAKPKKGIAILEAQ
jgi:hypothetical protein